jgi:hypothetical protein
MDRNKDKTLHGKYDPDLLIQMFRKVAALRNDIVAAGFTDNALKHYENAEFSDAAWELHQAKGAVLVEHASPRRHLTQVGVAMVCWLTDISAV